MERNSDLYKKYVEIMKKELMPAMGCTEPIAISYASAKARDVLGKMPEKVVVEASGNLIKNVKSVTVPNTEGLKGIEAAAAAGIVAGKSEKLLEVISEVSDEQKHEIKEFLEKNIISVQIAQSDIVFDLIVTLTAGEDCVSVRIVNEHTNIVTIEKNGEKLVDKPLGCGASDSDEENVLSVEGILDFAKTCEIDDVREIIKRQIDYNTAIADEGIEHAWGANVGKIILNSNDKNDVRVRAKARAAAGSDARMSGCEMPVVINSGSGNQGITASVPVLVYAKELKASEDKMYRALALSNLTAIHQKTPIGRLSAYCGAVSAGAGAGAGIAYLCGGGFKEVTHTVVNALAIVSGIVCDGAKASCAAKIASAVDAGILGYNMYKRGQQFRGGDGIVTKGIEGTLKNVGRLGKEGMKETNEEIIKIMIGD